MSNLVRFYYTRGEWHCLAFLLWSGSVLQFIATSFACTVWAECSLTEYVTPSHRENCHISHKHVLCYRQFFQRKFQDLDKQLFSQDRQLFPEDAFSEAAFLKMAVLLRSRIHSPLTDNDVALVPLADKVRLPWCSQGRLCSYSKLYIIIQLFITMPVMWNLYFISGLIRPDHELI